MKNDLIGIGIVLFNPNVDLLINNIKELKKISNNIFFIENGSSNISEIKAAIKDYKVIYNKSNQGIAKALNQLVELSIKEGMDYLLTLDQDSRMNLECFKEMYKYNDKNNVAIVCPRIFDINKKKNKEPKNRTEYVDRCITSGSLMNLSICKKLPGFDEKMFIDYVDFDYCKMLTINGYKILRVNEAIMKHEIGKRINRRFLFWNVYPTNHSNTKRYYYYSRNIKYYLRKYKGKITLKEYLKEEVILIWKIISVILYEENKKEKIKSFFNGLRDSRSMI